MKKTKWPDPVVQGWDGVSVVRDDLIPGGTKRRFLDEFVTTVKNPELVYAATAYGGAQLALALSCAEYDKRATIFAAKRKKLYPITYKAKSAGAKIVEVPMGFLSNVEAKAERYCLDSDAYLMPFGFDMPAAFESIAKAALTVRRREGTFDEVWCAVGSGVLLRSLQRAGLGHKYFGVAVGRDVEFENATIIRYPRPFAADAKMKPPFPSCSNYDAKVWEYVTQRNGKRVLFWNVMG